MNSMMEACQVTEQPYTGRNGQDVLAKAAFAAEITPSHWPQTPKKKGRLQLSKPP